MLADGGIAPRPGPTARVIAGGERVGSAQAVEAPDLADGVIG